MGLISVLSSGNAGASLAAYATVADMECMVITTEGMNPIGSRLLRKQEPKSYIKKRDGTWGEMAKEVERGRWYLATNFINPPVNAE